jgi:thymidylate kinase
MDLPNETHTPTGEGADHDELESQALAQLFEGLAQAGIRHAVLRNYDSLPRSVGARDIDILLLPDHLESAQAVVCGIAQRLRFAYANYYRDERMVQFALFRRLGSDSFFELKIDFFTNLQVYGVEVLPAIQMLENLRYHNGVPVVRDPFVFLDKWVFHLIVGQPVHAKYNAEFGRICTEHRDELLKLLCGILGSGASTRMFVEIATGNASVMKPLPRGMRLAILARCLLHSPVARARQLLTFLYHRGRNVLAPAGLFMSVSGPDGCGKTTVIDAVISDLDKIYGNGTVVYRHFRPAVLPRIAEVAKAAKALKSVDENYGEPHRANPSGRAGSLARLAYYGLDYLLGYAARVRPVMLQRRIALFDRYYYDMIGDPGRSRIFLPEALLRALGRLLPLPQFAVFLHVSPEVAYARKQELPLNTIRTLNARYNKLVEKGFLVQVNNDGPYREAVAHIVNAIVARRDAKARLRLRRFIRN